MPQLDRLHAQLRDAELRRQLISRLFPLLAEFRLGRVDQELELLLILFNVLQLPIKAD